MTDPLVRDIGNHAAERCERAVMQALQLFEEPDDRIEIATMALCVVAGIAGAMVAKNKGDMRSPANILRHTTDMLDAVKLIIESNRSHLMAAAESVAR